jgi:hypothetical protein
LLSQKPANCRQTSRPKFDGSKTSSSPASTVQRLKWRILPLNLQAEWRLSDRENNITLQYY